MFLYLYNYLSREMDSYNEKNKLSPLGR